MSHNPYSICSIVSTNNMRGDLVNYKTFSFVVSADVTSCSKTWVLGSISQLCQQDKQVYVLAILKQLRMEVVSYNISCIYLVFG